MEQTLGLKNLREQEKNLSIVKLKTTAKNNAPQAHLPNVRSSS
jgi:hypothetical protein